MKTCLLKNLKKLTFLITRILKDINEAYSDFTEKVASVIDEIAIHRTGLMLKLMKKLKGGTNY